jgi:N-methylhydantoinase B
LPAATGYTRLFSGESERDIGKVDVLELRPGDCLRIGTQGGGGLGDPLLRPTEMVAEDVRNGLVSAPAAARDYGVVFDPDGCVDAGATEALRAQQHATRSAEPPTFTFGAARDAYRQQWSVELEDALWSAVAAEPSVLRQFLHARLKLAIAERFRRGESVTPADVPDLVRSMRTRFTAGYPSVT